MNSGLPGHRGSRPGGIDQRARLDLALDSDTEPGDRHCGLALCPEPSLTQDFDWRLRTFVRRFEISTGRRRYAASSVHTMVKGSIVCQGLHPPDAEPVFDQPASGRENRTIQIDSTIPRIDFLGQNSRFRMIGLMPPGDFKFRNHIHFSPKPGKWRRVQSQKSSSRAQEVSRHLKHL